MADITPEALTQLVELARSNPVPQIAKGASVPYVVIPNAMKVHELGNTIFNEHAERPERIRGTVKVFDAASFCQYYSLFADDNSRVFADETASRVIAILDYHQPWSTTEADNPARWGQHRIDLTLRYSKEWMEWKAQDGKKTTQMDFAEFLEDHAPEIVSPDAATMLEVARSLSAKSDVDFSSVGRMSNGSIQLKYNEQVKGTYGNGQFDVPEAFEIGVPVYVGHDRVRLTARLRYRLNSGKLTFWFDLLRAAVAERDAFLAARSAIAQTLDIAIINGQAA